MTSRSRKSEILLEILSGKEFYNEEICLPKIADETHLTFHQRTIFYNNPQYYYQNRFVVRMETDDLIIKSERIKGFKIETINNEMLLKIKTFMHIDEWLEDFKTVEIIKIYFFDIRGNMLKNSFDYDVNYKSFSLACDYKFADYLTPVFEYYILSDI